MVVDRRRLREDISTLRFVNEKTGYNLDINYVLRQTYCAEKIIDSKLNRIILNGLVWTGASGAAFSAALMGERFAGKYGFVAGMILGGVSTGVILDHVFFIRSAKYLGFLRRSKEIKEIYDSEGIDGLKRREIGFDDLDFDSLPDYVRNYSRRN